MATMTTDDRKAKHAAYMRGYYHRKQKVDRAATPPMLCQCGCGTWIPSVSSNGQPGRFVKGHHNRVQPKRRGSASASWKGGESKGANGYVRCTIEPQEGVMYPTAYNPDGDHWNIARSHLVWNRVHPTDLVQKGEHVHHINRIRDDDRIENLQKMNGRDHLAMHGRRTKK